MAARHRLAAVVLLAALGCGGGDRAVTVTGKVTFQGQPVGEGTVQFNDARTGRGGEAELRPDGTYTTKVPLPPGTYAVVIVPPHVHSEGRETSADFRFKKVNNIPPKYHSTDTSRLSAVVSADNAVHDFDMRP